MTFKRVNDIEQANLWICLVDECGDEFDVAYDFMFKVNYDNTDEIDCIALDCMMDRVFENALETVERNEEVTLKWINRINWMDEILMNIGNPRF